MDFHSLFLFQKRKSFYDIIKEKGEFIMWYLYIYPYINLIISVLILLSGNMIEAANGEPAGLLTVAILAISYILAIIISLTTKNVSIKKAAIVKIVHIPYYVFAFIVAAIMFITVMGIPVTLAFVIGDILAIIPSGIYMARTNCQIWQKICGFVYVIDVIIAYLAWKGEKNERL